MRMGKGKQEWTDEDPEQEGEQEEQYHEEGE